jgi:hypothetical protein
MVQMVLTVLEMRLLVELQGVAEEEVVVRQEEWF